MRRAAALREERTRASPSSTDRRARAGARTRARARDGGGGGGGGQLKKEPLEKGLLEKDALKKGPLKRDALKRDPAKPELLKMSELSERTGVSGGTIRYYLREGVLGGGEDIVRTSRNMAYYPVEYVERIALIKRLQRQRYMPLRVIKGALAENSGRVSALIELEDRILERALQTEEAASRMPVREASERYEIPRNVLARLAEIGVLAPGRRGYDADDVKIIEALASFRAGGYEEALGFTVYETLRYREALEPLVAEEVALLLERLAGEVDVERAVQIVEAGVEPLRALIGAMHSKLLLAELRRQSEA